MSTYRHKAFCGTYSQDGNIFLSASQGIIFYHCRSEFFWNVGNELHFNVELFFFINVNKEKICTGVLKINMTVWIIYVVTNKKKYVFFLVFFIRTCLKLSFLVVFIRSEHPYIRHNKWPVETT